jgi:trimeric autotransporter adhesin
MKKLFTILALTIGFSINAQTGNTSYGTSALANITTGGDYNTASGLSSLYSNTTGSYNTASGRRSLYTNTEGDNNTASGFYSLYSNTTSDQNTALGSYSLFSNTTGTNNTASGYYSLYSNTTGTNNTGLGKNSRASAVDATNQTVIGYEATGQADNSVVLGNDSVTAVYMAEDSGAKVYAGEGSFTGDMTIGGDVNVSSDARLKSNIISLGSTLSKLLLIDGKTYTMNKDGDKKIGVLAQDIQKVFPELVSEDDNQMLAVNYQGLVPVLINAIKEQEDKITRLENLVEQLINNKK